MTKGYKGTKRGQDVLKACFCARGFGMCHRSCRPPSPLKLPASFEASLVDTCGKELFQYPPSLWVSIYPGDIWKHCVVLLWLPGINFPLDLHCSKAPQSYQVTL